MEVRREWCNIDLLIIGQEPAFVLFVENKVDSGEHSKQLPRYWRIVNENSPKVSKLHVFLTPDGTPASDPIWVAYSYRDLYRVLDRVRRTSASAIGGDVRVFLDHYLNLIGTRFMDDPQIDDLCRRIFKTHRQAIQLIYERVGRPAQSIATEVEAVVRSDGRVRVFCRSGKKVDLVPADWMKWLPDGGVDEEMPKRWLVLRFEATTRSLNFYFVLRHMNDNSLRKAILKSLVSNRLTRAHNEGRERH